jgi:fatty acid-binding protein DegV
VPVLRVRGRASLATVAGSLAEAESAVIDRIESIARDRPIITVATHAQNSGGAARLSAAAAQRLNVGESLITEIGPALGSLVGGGAHGLGFCVVQPAPGVAGSPG